MSVIISNKDIPYNSAKETGTSCKGISSGSLGVQGQVPSDLNQATTNKIPLNADNEDNVMVLGEEEWKDLFGNSMEITRFYGFSCKSSNEDNNNIGCNDKEKQKWSKTLNAAIMECGFLSRPVDQKVNQQEDIGEECIISGRNDITQK